MASTYSKAGASAAALLLVFGAAPACSGSGGSTGSSAAASASATAPETPSVTSSQSGGKAIGTTGEAPSTSPAGTPETVVFEVTGTGTALTIDLVPSGDERLYKVPLPWSTTVGITPDVTQLQVVVVGDGDAAPGCRITLDGKVVAEKPEGGDAHCVFDR